MKTYSALFTLAVSTYRLDTPGRKEISLKYLLLGGISIAIRPTSIISYIPFYLYHLVHASNWSARWVLIGRTIQMVIYVLLIVLGFDFIWFRSNSVTFITFLKGKKLKYVILIILWCHKAI